MIKPPGSSPGGFVFWRVRSNLSLVRPSSVRTSTFGTAGPSSLLPRTPCLSSNIPIAWALRRSLFRTKPNSNSLERDRPSAPRYRTQRVVRHSDRPGNQTWARKGSAQLKPPPAKPRSRRTCPDSWTVSSLIVRLGPPALVLQPVTTMLGLTCSSKKVEAGTIRPPASVRRPLCAGPRTDRMQPPFRLK